MSLTSHIRRRRGHHIGDYWRVALRIARDVSKDDLPRAAKRLHGFGRRRYLQGMRGRRALDLGRFMNGEGSGAYQMLRLAHDDFEHRKLHGPDNPQVAPENWCRVCILLDVLEPVAPHDEPQDTGEPQGPA